MYKKRIGKICKQFVKLIPYNFLTQIEFKKAMIICGYPQFVFDKKPTQWPLLTALQDSVSSVSKKYIKKPTQCPLFTALQVSLFFDILFFCKKAYI
jgi:hypothetical protein